MRNSARAGALTAGLALVAFVAGRLAAQATSPAPWMEPCVFVDVLPPVWCGEFAVPEDREDPAGRTILLRVVVVGARQAGKAEDPVFWLSGGPGGSATHAVPGVTRLLWQVRQERDLVFVDQRGTGDSNPLLCEDPGRSASLQAFFAEFLEPAFVRRCLAGQDTDVRLYTTPIAMDDLEAVRSALGYAKVNLIGGSYGTRAALVYLRKHPERVRSAVLKGVAPPEVKSPLQFARALERGLDGLFEACRADKACERVFPGLEGRWAEAMARFDPTGRIQVVVEHPRTGSVEVVTVPRGTFVESVRHTLYSIEEARGLPAIIAAAASGDFGPFARHELERAFAYQEGLATGMFLTVSCSEDVQFITADETRRATAGTTLGDYRVRRQIAACAEWPVAAVGEDYHDPVHAETPVLILSGELDTATPWEGGEAVARHLPQARHIVFPNASHDYANESCQTGLIAAFVRAGTARGLDDRCARQTRRPPFLVMIAP